MITWTFDAGYGPESSQACISLTDGIGRGLVATTVELSELAETEGVDALHSITLDFDSEGRLVGIELPGCATAVLPRDLLAERGFDESRYRRGPAGHSTESALRANTAGVGGVSVPIVTLTARIAGQYRRVSGFGARAPAAGWTPLIHAGWPGDGVPHVRYRPHDHQRPRRGSSPPA